jgi:hypothetical protein
MKFMQNFLSIFSSLTFFSTRRLSASLPAACSLFAHLRKGSIAAMEEGRVKAGGFIAAADN